MEKPENRYVYNLEDDVVFDMETGIGTHNDGRNFTENTNPKLVAKTCALMPSIITKEKYYKFMETGSITNLDHTQKEALRTLQRVLDEKLKREESNKKDIAWHRNFKWWHITLISLFCAVLYLITDIVIFDYIFVIGLIYSIILGIKNRKK